MTKKIVLYGALGILALTAVLSIFINIQQDQQIAHLEEQVAELPVLGTYISPNLPVPEADHITLDREGVCLRYQRPGWNSEGTYFPGTYTEEGHILTLIFEEKALSAVYADDGLYVFFPESGAVVFYERIAEVPTYLGVSSPNDIQS